MSVEAMSPTHFNQYVSQEVGFFEDGKSKRVSLLDAARMAETSANELFSDAKVLYGRVQISCEPQDSKILAVLNERFKTLVTLHGAIGTAVAGLNVDVSKFDPDAEVQEGDIMKSQAEVRNISAELKGVADKLNGSFLQGGTLFWYLPDYLKVIGEKVASASTNASA